MTDPRDLIQRLADAIDSGIPYELLKQSSLMVEVDAYLAQPVPEGPTDDELTWLWNHLATSRRQRMTWLGVDCLPETDYQSFARSVLRQWGCCSPTPH